MTNNLDLVDLAREIAEIARTTTDPETGRLLTELVTTLLEEAGLPPDDDKGGGEPPSHWISDLIDCPV
jgi:hypothetical protein